MRDHNPVAMFPYPVGILLFNRPAYAEQTLAALAAQEHGIDVSKLLIVRDGFAGSRDDVLGEPDQTSEVDALVEKYFPEAKFVRFDRNLGIALGYEELAAHAFSGNSEWAAFFEEDFVVDTDYTRVLEQLIEAARDAPRVVCLSATGDVAIKRTRGMETLYPDRHLWAYVMRRSMWDASRSIRESYLRLLARRPYWDRDTEAIISEMADAGLHLPGASQDFVKLGFMRAHGYLALNTGQAHGYYIGQVGLHHNEQLFEAWGYNRERPPRTEAPVIPPLTDEFLDEMERVSRAAWARELLGYRETTGERLTSMQRRLTALRAQLVATQEALTEVSTELSATRESMGAQATSMTGNSTVIDSRGGWTWFGGTSALSIGNLHLLGIVRRKGLTTQGESCLAVIDNSGSVIRTIPLLRQFPLDDHNVPTVVALNRHRFVVAVTGHGDSSSIMMAMGRVQADTVRVGRRVNIEFSEATSYAHVVPEGPDSFLLLTRCGMTSFRARRISAQTLEPLSDEMPVFPWTIAPHDPLASGRDGNRPYLITREHGSEVLFALTHDHPRAYRNGIVAGRFRGADICDLDGNIVHTLSPDAPQWNPFEVLTTIVSPGSPEIPWVHDIAPVVVDGVETGIQIAYSLADLTEREFRFGDYGRHPQLRYAVARRRTGDLPRVVFTASAGPSLYADEKHYAGGIALNPRNPDHIVYSVGSTRANDAPGPDPHPTWSLLSREVTGGREQIRLVSSGSGTNSIIRPLFSASAPAASAHALFTMRGRYTSYTDFSTRIDATVFVPGESCVDANGEHLDLMYPLRREGAMPTLETRFLRSLLRRSRSVVEFGAGGSTLLAFDAGVARVTSVESDVRLVGFLAEHARSYSAQFEVVVPPVREISAWGYSVLDPLIDTDERRTEEQASTGRDYAGAVLNFDNVDTVLIDGRFRVACALTVAQRVRDTITLIIDDYADREHYRVVETYLGRPRRKGRMAVFRLRKPVVVDDEVLSTYLSDPR